MSLLITLLSVFNKLYYCVSTNNFIIQCSISYIIVSTHGLLIEYGPICHIVKLPISMIRPFALVNNSHITLYPQLEKVSKSLGKYWGKYVQIPFYIISCITRDCIIVENIFLVQWEISILTSTLPNIVEIASIVIEIWQKYS